MRGLVAVPREHRGLANVLRIKNKQTELLTRMKLYVPAAYLRKHSVLPDIRSTTNVRDHPSIQSVHQRE